MNKFIGALITCLLIIYGPADAAEPAEPFNRINLQAEASAEIENDLMQVRLAAEAKGSSPADIADNINRDMGQALNEVKKYPTIKFRTGNYITRATYDKLIFREWEGSQALLLESKDVKTLSSFLGQLQQKLLVKSMSFTTSEEVRKTAEDKLITQALDAFKARARLITENMKASDYRIVNINIGTGGGYQPQIRTMELGKSYISAPAVEAGSSVMSVNVSGTIELVK